MVGVEKLITFSIIDDCVTRTYEAERLFYVYIFL